MNSSKGPTTVWAVCRGEAYEGGRVEGIFDTEAKAVMEAHKIMQKGYHRKPWTQEHHNYWISGCDTMDVTEYDIQ